MRGLQCPKSLYLTVHQSELAAPASEATQVIFDQGHAVGAEAQKRFADGVLIETEHWDQKTALKLTADALANGAHTIFEATFEHDGVLAKVDILNRINPRAGWNLIEVKSSTKVKPEHLDDVAIQKMVVIGAGLKVKEATLMHINNQCLAPDLSNLFTRQKITNEIGPNLAALPGKLKTLRTMLMASKPPKTEIGPHCDAPYECPYKAHCWTTDKIPSPSIFDFPKIGSKGWSFFDKGIVRLDDPRFGPFRGTDLKRIEAVRSGKRWVDNNAIEIELAEFAYPLYFLDFETIGHAIPVYPGTRPYQQVPFQFSVLIQEKAGGKLVEREYLHDEPCDPRAALAAALVKSIGPRGSIVAYNKGFEAACIRGLAEQFPKLKKKLFAFVDRLVDPLPIFRACVYDGGFMGSFSIKAVAPAILGKKASYDGLAVADGQAAQRAFVEMVAKETVAGRKRELRVGLLEYCRKDTEEMAGLVAWLMVQRGR